MKLFTGLRRWLWLSPGAAHTRAVHSRRAISQSSDQFEREDSTGALRAKTDESGTGEQLSATDRSSTSQPYVCLFIIIIILIIVIIIYWVTVVTIPDTDLHFANFRSPGNELPVGKKNNNNCNPAHCMPNIQCSCDRQPDRRTDRWMDVELARMDNPLLYMT